MKKLIIVALFLLPFVSSASFDKNLSYGAKGDSVKELQEFLTDEGVYSAGITGNFYSLTRTGVVNFQKKYGISPTSGFWGMLSRTKANSILDLTLDNSIEQSETGTVAPPVITEDDNAKLLQQLIDQTKALQLQNQSFQTIIANTTPINPVVPVEAKEIIVTLSNTKFENGNNPKFTYEYRVSNKTDNTIIVQEADFTITPGNGLVRGEGEKRILNIPLVIESGQSKVLTLQYSPIGQYKLNESMVEVTLTFLHTNPYAVIKGFPITAQLTVQ